MAVKDKAKIRAALSIIALSVSMGIDMDLLKGKKDSLMTKPGIELEQKNARKATSIKTYGNVKQESIEKLESLLSSYLDNTSYVDNVVLIEGDTVETFTKGVLKIPTYKLKKEGEKLSNSDNNNVNIYIAEDRIDEFVPAIAMSLNDYFRSRG